MKKLLSIIILIACCCVLFVGCSAIRNNGVSSFTESTTTQQSQLPQKHTISLTINNYSTYIEAKLVARLTAATTQEVVFTANGCLSYAYYENVVFEITHDGEKMLVACNAAGNGSDSYGGRNIGKVTGISGTIVYWM